MILPRPPHHLLASTPSATGALTAFATGALAAFALRGLVAIALVAIALAATAPSAQAHPQPYPHRHSVRRAAPGEASPPRRPRRSVEPTYRFPRLYIAIGPIGNAVMTGGANEAGNVDNLIEGGAGFEVQAGWRFNPYAGLDLALMNTFHTSGSSGNFDNATMLSFGGAIRAYLLPKVRRIEPYVLLGLGLYTLNRDSFATTLQGAGFQLGGGLDIHLNPVISLGLQAQYRGAFLDDEQATFGQEPIESAVLDLFTYAAHLRVNF